VAVSGGAVYACGTQGTVLRSTNLVDWVDVPTLTGKALNGMASNGPQIVVAGAEGVVLRAVAEPGSRPVRIGAYRHFRDTTPGIEALMFEGVAGQRFRWENGGDLGVWGLEAELELDLNGAVVVGRETGRPSRFHRAVTPP
jgi:urease beta subunit